MKGKKVMGKILRNKYLALIFSLVLFLVVWELLSRGTPLFLPGILETIEGGYELLARGDLFPYIGSTVYRILAGWVIGCAMGIPVGWAIGNWKALERITNPYINFFRFLPPIVWVTVFLIWFGYNDVTRIGLVAYATFVIVVIHSIVAIHEIPDMMLRAAGSLGAKGRRLFFRIKIPATIPHVFTGMRVAMGNAFMTIVAVEMLTASSGLGYMIWHARLYFRLEFAFICIALLGLFGFFTDLLMRKLGHKSLRKYGVIQ